MSNQFLLERLPPVAYKQEHPLREVFADIVDNLPEEDRLIIEAIMWEGISLAEAAHRLGLGAKQSAHYRLGRALGLVEDELKKVGYDVNSRRISGSTSAGDEDNVRDNGSATNNTNTQ